MSTVAIKIDGTDITADVVIAGAEFNTQVNGVPGSSKFRIRDNNRTYSITTGKSLTLDIDGSRAWTGYVTQVKRVYQFDAQATNPLPGRFLDIEGVDINILFTRRVVFNKTTPTTVPGPTFGANTPDTTAISSLVTNYLDLSSDSIDTSSMVTGVANVNQGDPWNGWAASYTWADAMNTIIRQPGSIYYLDPSSRLVYCDVDTPTAPYALSDQPAVDGAKPYREMEILYDGGSLDNDHITWGAGYGSKSVVVSRVQDSASQATHGRWQDGAFLSDVYKQTTVDRISNSYVYGSPTNHRGGKDDKVAVVVSTYQPGFRAAQKVTFTSHAYGYSDTLPIRQMQITFPTPTDPKYRLTLSHAIDAPWGFIDQYFPNLNFNLVAPVVGGIGNICLDCVGMTVNVPGTCNCGITDTFTRTTSPGMGTSDSGLVWSDGSHPATSTNGSRGVLASGSYPILPTNSTSRSQSYAIDFTTASAAVTGTGAVAIFWFGPMQGTSAYGFYLQLNQSQMQLDGYYNFEIYDRELITGSLQPSTSYHLSWQYDLVAGTASATLTTGGTQISHCQISGLALNGTPLKAGGFAIQNGTSSSGYIQYIDNLDISGVNACTQYHFDSFNRSVASGWGTSDYGTAWTVLNATNANASVNGNYGVLAGTASSYNIDLRAASPGPWDSGNFTETTLVLTPSNEPSNGWSFYRTVAGSTNTLICSLYAASGGAANLSIQLGDNSNSNYYTTAFGRAANQPITVKWTSDGTTLSAKAWPTGSAEPAWQVTYTLSAPLGTASYYNVNWSSGYPATTIQVDSIDFDYAGKPCYQDCPPAITFDSFTRTVANGWGTSDYGDPWTTRYSSGSPSISVDGSSGVATVASPAQVEEMVVSPGPWDGGTWTMLARLTCSGSGTRAEMNFIIADSTSGEAFTAPHYADIYFSPGDILYVEASSGVYDYAFDASTISGLYGTFLLKWEFNQNGVSRAKVWVDGTTEPAAWGTSMTVPFSFTPSSFNVFFFNHGGTQTTNLDYITFEQPCTSVYSVAGTSVPTSGFWCESLTPSGSVLTTSAPYQYGTTEVYKNGLLLANGSDYTETSWTAGTITLAVAPAGETYRVCYVATVISGGGGGGRPLVR